MPTEPIYTSANTTAAYQLNWTVTVFWRVAPPEDVQWLLHLGRAVEPDGVRVLEHRFADERTSQFFLSTKPQASPRRFLRSVKGRLQYLVRDRLPKALRRHYAFRGVGSAKTRVVEAYIADQLGHHGMADERVQARLRGLQRVYGETDLSQPRRSAHGQYWYNLHLALANEGRWMEVRDEVLARVAGMAERAAERRGHALSRLSVLPDHMHLALGCHVSESPQEVALCYLNNCAYACDMRPVFRFSYYVGTFGEYDLGAIR